MAYIGLMVLFVTLGCVAVWFFERHPTRRTDTVRDFRRGMDALAPHDEKKG